MIYTLIVAAVSLAGAAIPLRTRLGHAQLQVYLSLAAGALLGAALFHLLPEASEHIGRSFGLPAVIGVGLVFLLQRYLAPHSHEPLGIHPSDEHHDPGAPGLGEGSAAACDHAHGLHEHDTDHARLPVSGMVAVLALSIHSFFDGVAISAASETVAGGQSLGLAVFFSVLIHKPMDGLAVSVLLMNGGTRGRKLWLIQILYAALVPLGAVAFTFTRGAIAQPSALIGYTLAFSAGTFLAIALTDLLPELHFHAHDRHKLSAALLAGLVIMWLTSRIGHASPDDHADQGKPAVSMTIIDIDDKDRRRAAQGDSPTNVQFAARGPFRTSTSQPP